MPEEQKNQKYTIDKNGINRRARRTYADEFKQQIVNLYKLMSKLGGPYGNNRQTEMFVYSKKDREAIERCQELGL